MVSPTSLSTSRTTADTSGHIADHNTVHGAVNELTALGMRVLVYASGAYPSRPTGVPAGMVRYIGPVAPTTSLAGDDWVTGASSVSDVASSLYLAANYR